ncbi:acetyl-CoA carboxylase carboxyltransferase subunit beta [Alkalibacter sp. M17DMB]|nr:acetyl-CoA carboxylase, carboxyltransferase subunit beta [Alkalibacter mobilis]MBF7095930.1 acetyl-CoA carboxylase carboxyltransferase subunit beta [Alkalibacter mobilis]
MFKLFGKQKKFNAKQFTQKDVPQQLYTKCDNCNDMIYYEDLKLNLDVCPKCSHHIPIGAYRRLEITLDPGSFREFNRHIKTGNPLDFPTYEDKLAKASKASGIKEAVITGYGDIQGKRSVVCVMDSNFMMGSMGSVVGEKITRAIEKSIKHKIPLIIFCASGGARMQEGIVSLMQMAKVSSSLKKHSEEGLLYISILTHPTTGGVTASFAMLGDIILAEPGALIGFAGPRVIKQTIRQDLPEGFQSAQFLQDHGFLDKVVHRKDMTRTLSKILKIHGGE